MKNENLLKFSKQVVVGKVFLLLLLFINNIIPDTGREIVLNFILKRVINLEIINEQTHNNTLNN